MPTLLQLREERANAWAQAQDFNERHQRGDEMSAENSASWDRALADVDRLGGEIARIERTESLAEEFRLPPATGDVTNRGGAAATPDEAADRYARVFANYLARGAGRLSYEDQQILATGASNDEEVAQRAQAIGTGGAGGYLVPAAFRDEFIKVMKDFGAVQRVAQVIETDTGANLSWPKMDDTGNVGAILAENTQMSELDVAVTTASLDAYMYTSKLTRGSLQVVQDSAFDVEDTVQDAHGERIGRITNQHFTTGTGTAQPDGIVTSAVSGVTAAGVAVVTADELIDLEHSVDPAYRRSPRSRFMLSDTALKGVRKLKDSDNQYLWQVSMQAGVPATILGYGYEINQDMAAPAAGVKSVLFGDFYAGYLIRIVRDLQTIVFTERFMDYLQLGWASFMRADGTAQNTSAYRALTQAAS